MKPNQKIQTDIPQVKMKILYGEQKKTRSDIFYKKIGIQYNKDLFVIMNY